MQFVCCAFANELELVKEAGFQAVELRGKEIAAMSDEDFKVLRSELDRLELHCVGFNAYCPAEIVIAGPGYSRENTRNYAKHLAERAAALSISQVGIGSPMSRTLPEGYDRNLAFSQVCEFCADTAEQFAPVSVNTGFEPLCESYCNFINTCDEGLQVIQAVNDPHVGLILDYYNLERQGESDRSLDDLLGHILHVHISDDVAGDPSQRFTLNPEKYEIHRQRLQYLQRIGYNGTVSVETDLPLARQNMGQTLRFLLHSL